MLSKRLRRRQFMIHCLRRVCRCRDILPYLFRHSQFPHLQFNRLSPYPFINQSLRHRFLRVLRVLLLSILQIILPFLWSLLSAAYHRYARRSKPAGTEPYLTSNNLGLRYANGTKRSRPTEKRPSSSPITELIQQCRGWNDQWTRPWPRPWWNAANHPAIPTASQRWRTPWQRPWRSPRRLSHTGQQPSGGRYHEG